ncbi:inositol monophosphatase, partial [bacterium]
VSRGETLKTSLLGTGFPFRVREYLYGYIELFKLLFNQCRGIRRAGAAVIDLAYVAAGRLDGFFELYLKPWDMAAGALLVEEAGGVVSDMVGASDFLESGHIIAANPHIYDNILTAARSVFEAEELKGLGTGFRPLR